MVATEDAEDGGLALATNAPQKTSAASANRPPTYEQYQQVIRLL